MKKLLELIAESLALDFGSLNSERDFAQKFDTLPCELQELVLSKKNLPLLYSLYEEREELRTSIRNIAYSIMDNVSIYFLTEKIMLPEILSRTLDDNKVEEYLFRLQEISRSPKISHYHRLVAKFMQMRIMQTNKYDTGYHSFSTYMRQFELMGELNSNLYRLLCSILSLEVEKHRQESEKLMKPIDKIEHYYKPTLVHDFQTFQSCARFIHPSLHNLLVKNALLKIQRLQYMLNTESRHVQKSQNLEQHLGALYELLPLLTYAKYDDIELIDFVSHVRRENMPLSTMLLLNFSLYHAQPFTIKPKYNFLSQVSRSIIDTVLMYLEITVNKPLWTKLLNIKPPLMPGYEVWSHINSQYIDELAVLMVTILVNKIPNPFGTYGQVNHEVHIVYVLQCISEFVHKLTQKQAATLIAAVLYKQGVTSLSNPGLGFNSEFNLYSSLRSFKVSDRNLLIFKTALIHGFIDNTHDFFDKVICLLSGSDEEQLSIKLAYLFTIIDKLSAEHQRKIISTCIAIITKYSEENELRILVIENIGKLLPFLEDSEITLLSNYFFEQINCPHNLKPSSKIALTALTSIVFYRECHDVDEIYPIIKIMSKMAACKLNVANQCISLFALFSEEDLVTILDKFICDLESGNLIRQDAKALFAMSACYYNCKQLARLAPWISENLQKDHARASTQIIYPEVMIVKLTDIALQACGKFLTTRSNSPDKGLFSNKKAEIKTISELSNNFGIHKLKEFVKLLSKYDLLFRGFVNILKEHKDLVPMVFAYDIKLSPDKNYQATECRKELAKLLEVLKQNTNLLDSINFWSQKQPDSCICANFN